MALQSQVAASGKVVGIYFTLKDKGGAVLDTNRRGGKPMPYLHGAGNILPALEKALEGKAKNDFVDVVLPAEQAYGLKKPELIHPLDRKAFPPNVEIAVGMRFSGKDPQGRMRTMLVLAVDGDSITVDENHPLADQELHFEVTVCGVRDATAEEVAHGHPHGPGSAHNH
jgi:FKBP-type peptidyl-prolyl cis-trans isomerase SlyD